jgi:hypothetical protein
VNLKNHTIVNAPFTELTAVQSVQSENSLLDIVIEDKINLDSYCYALLLKILELRQSKFPDFLDYQLSLSNDKLKWLNKLEKLIASNEDLFTQNKALSRYNKLYNLIQQKRIELQSTSLKDAKIKTPKKYINADCEDRYFSFYELKKQLEAIKDEDEQILLLTKELFEFESASIEFVNHKIEKFDIQCRKEIEHIYALRKLKTELEQAKKNTSLGHTNYSKMKFNCNVNQFVDIFYQLTRELFSEGKPILDGSINDLAIILTNSFVDKDGRELSPETIKTILTPSKSDKRPKPHKRIDIDNILKN